MAGIFLFIDGLTTVGEIVMFMSFAGLLIQRLEQAAGFINHIFMDAPRLQQFFAVLDTVSAVRDLPDAIVPGTITGAVEFDNVSFSYDGKMPVISGLNFSRIAGGTVALVGATGAGNRRALAMLHRAFDPQSGTVALDGTKHPYHKLAALRRNVGVVVPGTIAVQPVDRRKSARR